MDVSLYLPSYIYSLFAWRVNIFTGMLYQDTSTTAAPAVDGVYLLENGDYLIAETGDYLATE